MGNNPSALDKIESRLAKEKQKTLKFVKKQFRALQFHYDMLKIEQADLAHLNPESPECQAYLDVDQRFFFIVSNFIIEPFGSRLNADLA